MQREPRPYGPGKYSYNGWDNRSNAKGDSDIYRCNECGDIFESTVHDFCCPKCGGEAPFAPMKIRDRLLRGRG